MRQVPQYLLIGNGRVARHFRHYFSLLNISFLSWCRQDSLEALQAALPSVTHILLLISDQAIETFIEQHLMQTQAVKIHFSGCLTSKQAYGAHPLMSFNQTLYELTQYQQIPFVMDEDAPDFEVLLPGLSNQHARLSKANKAKYHAYCVLANNFSCLLWQRFIKNLGDEFKLPTHFAHPILRQSLHNILTSPHAALTGPLVRHDLKTIADNLNALNKDPFKQVYQSFVDAYQIERESK